MPVSQPSGLERIIPFRINAAAFDEFAHLNDFLFGQGVRRYVKVGRMAVQLHVQLAAAGMPEFGAQFGKDRLDVAEVQIGIDGVRENLMKYLAVAVVH